MDEEEVFKEVTKRLNREDLQYKVISYLRSQGIVDEQAEEMLEKAQKAILERKQGRRFLVGKSSVSTAVQNADPAITPTPLGLVWDDGHYDHLHTDTIS